MPETVYVGSGNPVKLEAVKAAFDSFYDREFDFERVSVDPGVSETPSSLEEARKGARNRALQATDEGYGVGIEAYVVRHFPDSPHFLSMWVAIAMEGEVRSEAQSGSIALPEKVSSRVDGGEDLATVISEIHDEEGIGREQGTVGIYTDGEVTRKEFTERAVLLCLAGLDH